MNCVTLPSASGNAVMFSSAGVTSCLSLVCWVTWVATISIVFVSTPAWALYACSKPPPEVGMMRDSLSLRLTWSLAVGPAVGGFGFLPRGFYRFLAPAWHARQPSSRMLPVRWHGAQPHVVRSRPWLLLSPQDGQCAAQALRECSYHRGCLHDRQHRLF